MAKKSDEEKKSRGPGFRLGLFLGLIAGAAIGSLIASNQRAREQAAGYWRQTEEGVEGLAAQTGADEMAEEITGRARATITRIRSRFHEAVEEGKEAAQETEIKEYERYEEKTGREQPPEEQPGI